MKVLIRRRKGSKPIIIRMFVLAILVWLILSTARSVAADKLEVARPVVVTAGNIMCVEFRPFAAGVTVEGPGMVHPFLNISSSGDAVTLFQGQLPATYGAPNGPGSLLNGGIVEGGFGDITRAHDYRFTFVPGMTVNQFSVQMLDYGDFNPLRVSNHEVSLVGYDAGGNEVDRDTLSFTSDGSVNPAALQLSGDAVSAQPGDPGNRTYMVSSSGMTTVEIQYSSDGQPVPSDPNFGLAVLCFEPELPQPPTPPVCADFSGLTPGASVEGLGAVHPFVNISSSGNTLALFHGLMPATYGAPNGPSSVLNGGLFDGGFGDITRTHDYVFTFVPGMSVSQFSVQMLDYGDFNPAQINDHEVALVAFDASGAEVSRDTLVFASEAQVNPPGMWAAGDAVSAVPGEPGNRTYYVSGSGISRVEFQYISDGLPIPSGPNMALTKLCFDPEIPQPPLPSVCADFAVLPAGTSVEGLGTVHPFLNISSTGNTVALQAGQMPATYGAPNGPGSILNGGIVAGGFGDVNRVHDYSFSFIPGMTVSKFTVLMLDYGDFNPGQASSHEVALVGFDANGVEVGRDTLLFASDGSVNPPGLQLSGDAVSGQPGEPGNRSYTVSGPSIARLEMQYLSDGQATPSDPNFGMAVLCFEPENPPDFNGCTAYFWKQEQHQDLWVNYSPTDDYETVFGVNASFTATLLATLELPGGGDKALSRQATAALLNAASPLVNYAFTEAQIIALVQDAHANGTFAETRLILKAQNESGCPIPWGS